MIGMIRTFRHIDRDEITVDPESITLGVTVGKQTPLQHLVGRQTYTVDYIRRIERRLFYLGIKIFGITVKFEYTYITQREILVIPHFSEVKRIDVILAGLLLCHYLHLQFPARVVTSLDSIEKIALIRLAVFGYDSLCLGISEIFNTLESAEMKFHPHTFIILVDKTERVASKAVHMSERCRYAARRHGDGHLMESLGQKSPEIPIACGIAHTCTRVALDGMIEIRKLQRVTQEKHRRIIAYKIPVPLIGIKFHRKATDVALSVSRATLAGHSRKSHKTRSLLAYL